MEYERRVQLLLTASRVLRPRGARASEPLQPEAAANSGPIGTTSLHSGEEVGTGQMLARRSLFPHASPSPGLC